MPQVSAILSEDEKDLGVCVVDMGSGTMDISVYISGALQHSVVLDYAGNSVTSDIAIAFSSPLPSAEKVKIKHGCLVLDNNKLGELIELPGVGGRATKQIPRQDLLAVIEPRYSELLGLVKKELYKLESSFATEGLQRQLAAGVVITGGAAQIEGFSECGRKCF